MVPVFDRFQGTMERLTNQQQEDKLIKKMAGIYNILPRLKVPPLVLILQSYAFHQDCSCVICRLRVQT